MESSNWQRQTLQELHQQYFIHLRWDRQCQQSDLEVNAVLPESKSECSGEPEHSRILQIEISVLGSRLGHIERQP